MNAKQELERILLESKLFKYVKNLERELYKATKGKYPIIQPDDHWLKLKIGEIVQSILAKLPELVEIDEDKLETALTTIKLSAYGYEFQKKDYKALAKAIAEIKGITKLKGR